MFETLLYTYFTCTHFPQESMCIHTLGGNYALLQAHVQCRYKQDKWTDKHRSVQTGKQTDIHTHAGSQYWATPQTWHPLDPSWGHLKGLKAISPSFFCSLFPLSPSFLRSFLWPLSKQPIMLMALFSTLSTPFPPPSLPLAVWVTSRNPELTSPKGCFGR